MAEAQTGRGRGDLPVEMTSFVGRRRDAAEVRRLLSSARLVTLTGTGGVGKTRLAMRVAQALRRAFADGVWWVDLDGLDNPDLVAPTVLQTLDAEQPASGKADDVARYLAGRQVLLVLDTCGYLLEACAQLVGAVLAAAPQVRVLATSREPLGAPGEHTFDVQPLSVPDGDWAADPLRREAVTLFEERAAAVAPGFAVTEANRQVVVLLCRKLDGLPLAIELAASRTRVLPVAEILRRWDNQSGLVATGRRRRLPRHQTLRAAMDWSFRLCSEDEQVLLAQLSVFTGSFTLHAAEAICGGAELEVLPALAALVRKSLVVRELPSDRYRLLETVRWYAGEHLAGRGEQTELSRRHQDYYLHLARIWEAGWSGPAQEQLFAQIQGERANLHAALTFSLTTPGQQPAALHMARLLWTYWWFRPWAESEYWLNRILAATTQPSPDRNVALAWTGVVAVVLGNREPGLAMASQARQLAHEMADAESVAHTTFLCAIATVIYGKFDLGRTLAAEGLELELALPEPNPHVRLARHTLAVALEYAGRIEQAVAVYAALDAELEEAGEHLLRSSTLIPLAINELLRGRTAKAASWAQEVIKVHRTFQGSRELNRGIEILTWTAVEEGDYVRAARLTGIAQGLRQQVGQDPTSAFYLNQRTKYSQRARQALGSHAFEAELRKAARFGFEEAIGYALGTVPERPTAIKNPVSQALTKRERQIVGLVAEGLSNKQIADRLVISRRTAENHVENILTKLGLTSRLQIASWATEHRT